MASAAGAGAAFLHTVIDDHSRVDYAEICTYEKADNAIGVLRWAVTWFAEHGVTVLSDNGSAYRSSAWRERFHRTLAQGWAHAQLYESTQERDTALPGCLHYNHHRAHSVLGGWPPAPRLTNLPGHHA